jgi:hypothetical protein
MLSAKVPPCLYTAANGHMFSLLTKQGYLVLRLPEKEREAFMKKYKTGPVMQYGALMKEYVEVPHALLKKTKELQKFFEVSYEYVSSLRPKPTQKASKKKR